MTNREKYRKQLIKIALSGYNVAVVNSVPIRCTYLESCHGCDFFGSEDCKEDRHAWLDADDGEETREEVLEVEGRLEETVSGETLAGILDQAYITCVSAVISGDNSAGDSDRDMNTLYGIHMMFREAMKRMEGKQEIEAEREEIG